MRAPASELVVGLSSGARTPGNVRPDGIGVYTTALRLALEAAGTKVRAVASPFRDGWRIRPPMGADLAFPLPLAWLATAGTILRRPTPWAASIERGIDVYHSTDYIIPRLRRTPVVATIYDAIPLVHPHFANPRLRSLKNRLMRNWAQAADAVIAISHAAVPEIVEHYRIPQERIRVVPPGVDADWFEAPATRNVADVLARLGITRGYYLHVGTLQPRKNLDRLVSAYERLPEAEQARRQLVLVGQYGWCAEELVERLDTLRPRRRVVWVDYVGRDDLRALYAGAGAFVFPSLAEGFGLPVVEALASGLPVIASDLPVLREVGGLLPRFFPPHDVDALSAAMAEIGGDGDPASSDDLVALRRSHARRYDWESTAMLTIAAYREVERR